MPEQPQQDDAPPYDVFLQGTVYLDIILTGLPAMPTTGTEVWADGMGSCPGGIANLAIASSRLGLRTSLAAAFGDDLYGSFCWDTLCNQEGVDLSASRRFPGWHSPVTVSFAVDRDRSMVTHAHPAPLSPSEMIAASGGVPRARAGIVHITENHEPWTDAARAQGTLLFGDVGWDPTGEWSGRMLEQLEGFHAFMPNSVEAMGYTRTDDPRAALHALARHVPLAVVTCGGQGALAVDATTGEEEWAPSLPVNAYDPTGAGDVFGAAFVLGTLQGWPLRHRLAFANLCAALSVQHVGGSLAAPGWGDIVDWWDALRAQAQAGSSAAEQLAASYAFLDDVVPCTGVRAVRRATATIARISDV